jgi:Amino acid synthesis
VEYAVRKWLGLVEQIEHDGGPAPTGPLFKAIAAAVIYNPCSESFTEDLSLLVDPSAQLGRQLIERAIALVGNRSVEGYGKGAIAGVSGEQEHAVACLTTPFGDALRDGVGGGKAWIPSNTKVAACGEGLDVPLAYKEALSVRSHYDTASLRIPDAPRPQELVIAVAISTGGRVHHRLGGLKKAEAIGDGVR